MISAEIIADSVNPVGNRLTTVKCIYPWFIHGEVMTHRVFSRNASSNRAVPTHKLIEEARNPGLQAMPSFGVVNAPGMQGGRETTENEKRRMEVMWESAALAACNHAELLVKLGAAKQDVNRLLMPFTHARVLISATEWDNFFGLRLHKDAQPEARMLAQAIYEAMQASKPMPMLPGQWHLPYVTKEDMLPLETLKRVSVARCARVSYESFETGKRSTVNEDLLLYERLVGSQPMHASPAEHQGTPDSGANAHRWGNFRGWVQYRKTLRGEAVAPMPEGYDCLP